MTGTMSTDWSKYPPHPHSFPDNKSGAFTMSAGDIVKYDLDGRMCRLDECLHDGDAFVTWEDGSYATVQWNNLSPIRSPQ
jgi:hypothetical protein